MPLSLIPERQGLSHRASRNSPDMIATTMLFGLDLATGSGSAPADPSQDPLAPALAVAQNNTATAQQKLKQSGPGASFGMPGPSA